MIKAAQYLSEIIEAHARLRSRALDHGGHRLMPGGPAMAALGPVANLEAWENLNEATELYGRTYTSAVDEDPEKAWSPAQTIEFWAEDWRRERDAEYEMRRNLTTEAKFLKHSLEWAWDHEPRFDDFVADMKAAKVKLENLLMEGTRVAFQGVECMYEECGGSRLIRKTVPTRGPDGEKAWRLTDWHCPKCKRSWDERRYASNIYGAVERAHWMYMEDETWCTIDRAARRVGRPQGTVRSWVSRGEVAAVCLLDSERTFVLLADVEERDQVARERRARWLRARAAKRMTMV